jgi:hypothetical protein
MADYIDREELRTSLVQLPPCESESLLNKVLKTITDLHSVDAVEVVMCKDCKHTIISSADKMFTGKLHCRFTGICVDDDFFCKWGEKE